MSEIKVENQICSSCKTEIRKGALFCYSCGSSILPETVSDKVYEKLPEKSIKKNGNKNKSDKTQLVETQEVEPVLTNEKAENPEIISKPDNSATLKSAASIRNKNKGISKREVEIVWEEYEKAPNAAYILTAIIIAAFALGILWFALYFK